jgi:hypothetical protein
VQADGDLTGSAITATTAIGVLYIDELKAMEVHDFGECDHFFAGVFGLADRVMIVPSS